MRPTPLLALFLACTLPAPALNVVFILADDLGYGELGCFGQQKIRTPNLDRLAAEGTKLTRHYTGAPVCAPPAAS
jgi:arylsulfatase A